MKISTAVNGISEPDKTGSSVLPELNQLTPAIEVSHSYSFVLFSLTNINNEQSRILTFHSHKRISKSDNHFYLWRVLYKPIINHVISKNEKAIDFCNCICICNFRHSPGKLQRHFEGGLSKNLYRKNLLSGKNLSPEF